MARWHSLVPTLLVGFFTIFLVARSEVDLANHKLIWNDEGQELTVSCAVPTSQLLLQGAAPQPSPEPLYYLLLKAMVRQFTSLDQNVLAKLRGISLFAATACLCIIFCGFFLLAGPATALFALASLCCQPIFHRYAAEDRPYMMWLMLLTALLLTAARLGAKPWHKVTVAERASLAALGFLLAFEVSPGMFEYAAVAVCLNICWYARSENKKHLRFLATTIGLFLMLGYFYTRHFIHDTPILELDFALTHNWGLIREVVALLFPVAGRVAGAKEALLTCLAGLGLLLPALLWKSRAQRPLLFSTSLVSALQVLLAIPVAGLVIWHHYFFIQRVFIFLVVCQAFLVACGSWFLVETLARQHRLAPCLALIPALWLLSAGVAGTRQWVSRKSEPHIALADSAAIPCESLRGTLKFYHLPEVRKFAVGPNLLAGIEERLRECHWRESFRVSNDSPKYIIATSASIDPDFQEFKKMEISFRLSPIPPAGAIPFQLCGKPIELTAIETN